MHAADASVEPVQFEGVLVISDYQDTGYDDEWFFATLEGRNGELVQVEGLASQLDRVDVARGDRVRVSVQPGQANAAHNRLLHIEKF